MVKRLTLRRGTGEWSIQLNHPRCISRTYLYPGFVPRGKTICSYVDAGLVDSFSFTQRFEHWEKYVVHAMICRWGLCAALPRQPHRSSTAFATFLHYPLRLWVCIESGADIVNAGHTRLNPAGRRHGKWVLFRIGVQVRCVNCRCGDCLFWNFGAIAGVKGASWLPLDEWSTGIWGWALTP